MPRATPRNIIPIHCPILPFPPIQCFADKITYYNCKLKNDKIKYVFNSRQINSSIIHSNSTLKTLPRRLILSSTSTGNLSGKSPILS